MTIRGARIFRSRARRAGINRKARIRDSIPWEVVCREVAVADKHFQLSLCFPLHFKLRERAPRDNVIQATGDERTKHITTHQPYTLPAFSLLCLAFPSVSIDDILSGFASGFLLLREINNNYTDQVYAVFWFSCFVCQRTQYKHQPPGTPDNGAIIMRISRSISHCPHLYTEFC